MKTASFNGMCLSRSSKVLVTKRISHPFRVVAIHCRFPRGCENKLKLRFYVSDDDDAPTTGAPNGVSLLMEYGQIDYIIGDGDSKDMRHEVDVPHANSWLKVYAENDDYYAHEIDVQITLEQKERL